MNFSLIQFKSNVRIPVSLFKSEPTRLSTEEFTLWEDQKLATWMLSTQMSSVLISACLAKIVTLNLW